MDSLQKISNDLVNSINEKEKKKTIPYDTYAKVIRINGGTAWVHIPGGVDETPVAMTVNANVGDSVLVRVSGGNAWIVGNSSAPPTDDTAANKASHVAGVAQVQAKEAWETAQSIEGIASDAKSTAEEALSQIGTALTTDTLHYLATSADSGVTINTPGWTTTVQSMDSTNRYLWTYHTYTKAGGQSTHSTPVITGVYGEQGENGTSIKYVFIRDNWTQSGWATRTVGTTMQVTPKNYNSSGTVSNPPNYDYQNVKVGDLIMVTGTATDTKVAWTNIYKVRIAPGSSAADIPSTCQSHVYADRGAQGAQGVSVTAVQPQYYLSTSSSELSGGTWGTTLDYASGYYIWTRDEITYSNGTTGYSTAIYNKALTDTCAISYNTKQYFWTKSDNGTTAVPTGTYVTEKKQSEYDDTQGGTPTLGSVLIRSAGIYLRQAATTIAQFLAAGVTLFNPSNGKKRAEFNASGVKLYSGDASETELASFGTSEVTIQKASLRYSEDGSAFGLDNSHRVVLAKATDESGVRNDATLSSRKISTWDQTKPMGFVNANHYVNGSTKYGEVGMYTWGGDSYLPRYVVLRNGNGSGADYLEISSGNLSLDDTGLILSTGVISASNITTDEANIAELQDDVTTLYNNKADSTGFFKVVDLSWTEPVINAHSNGTNTTHTVASANRPAGMALVGIVGWQSSNYRLYPYVFHTNGAHSISVTMANATAANSASATVHAYLLYVKATSA